MPSFDSSAASFDSSAASFDSSAASAAAGTLPKSVSFSVTPGLTLPSLTGASKFGHAARSSRRVCDRFLYHCANSQNYIGEMQFFAILSAAAREFAFPASWYAA